MDVGSSRQEKADNLHLPRVRRDLQRRPAVPVIRVQQLGVRVEHFPEPCHVAGRGRGGEAIKGNLLQRAEVLDLTRVVDVMG